MSITDDSIPASFTPRRRRLAWSLLALVVLLSTGCTSFRDYVHNGFKVGPQYHRPPAPVAVDWIDAADVRVRSDQEPPVFWWGVFHDPVLDSLIVEASQQNLTLREAGFRVVQARANLGIQVGGLFPQQQDLYGAYSRNAVSTLTANSGFLQKRFFSQWDVGGNLAWELDFWGRFRRAIEAADADLDASVENYDDVLVTLLGDVAGTYVQIRTVQREIALVRANIALQQETLAIAQARFNGGFTSELDVDQAQANLSQTEAQIPQFEIQLRQAENSLCILLGIPPEDLDQRLGAGDIPTAPPEAAVGIPAQLLVRRPDVRRAEREAAAACARIGVAESELYPHIAVTGTVGFSAEQFGDLFKNRSFQGTIGPSFQWNVLNYGRLVNNIRFEDARFGELVTAYQNTVLNANAEVENGLVQFLQSQQTARFLAESVNAAERAVRVALVQYQGGLVDFNRVALLEQNLVVQQDLLAQAQGDIAFGLVQVYKSLGGGWQIRLGPPPMMVGEVIDERPLFGPPGVRPDAEDGGLNEELPLPPPGAPPVPVLPEVPKP